MSFWYLENLFPRENVMCYLSLSFSLTGHGELLQEISCRRMSFKFATGKPLVQRYGLYIDIYVNMSSNFMETCPQTMHFL